MVKLNLQINCINKKNIPKKNKFKYWLNSVLQIFKMHTYEVTIRIVDELESNLINMKYRKKNIPTNIISFPFIEKKINLFFLGDLVICNQLIEQEALYLKRELFFHWAHIVIHGCLHLLGFKHYNKKEEKKMELMEIKIMTKIGYKNPYI